MDWQPIESAPKDGTRILLYRYVEKGSKHIQIGRWSSARAMGRNFLVWSWATEANASYSHPPTHWMPLPSLPQTQRQDEEAPLGADEREQLAAPSA